MQWADLNILRSFVNRAGSLLTGVRSGWATEASSVGRARNLTFGASVAVNAAVGNSLQLLIDSATAYTIANPTKPAPSDFTQRLQFIISNISGDFSGAGSFGNAYVTTGDIPVLADGEYFVIEFFYNGSVYVESSRSTVGAGTLAQIFTKTVDLTNAQLIALPTTPQTIVAAPGAGFIWVPISAFWQIKAVAHYTNIDANAYALISLGDDEAEPLGNFDQARATAGTKVQNLLGNSGGAAPEALACIMPANNGFPVEQSVGAIGANISDFTNKAIRLYMFNAAAGNLTGGDAGNGARITVIYQRVAALA